MKPEALRRAPLLVLGGAALVTGLWAGLARLGAVASSPASVLDHGPLMVAGFLGTVIALERAVAARVGWAFLAPALNGAGAVALVLGQHSVGAAAVLAGSAVLLAVQLSMLRHGGLHLVVLTAASAALFAGNVGFALGVPIFDVVPMWLLFLVGTIAAERLELSRMLPRPPSVQAAFLGVFGLFVLGGLLALFFRDLGFWLMGAGALGLAAWMLLFDVARRTVKQPGQVRFIAVALLSGYLWLGVFGLLALLFGHPLAGPRYDALLHAVLVGFVFSMIFGHALVIVPAVLGVKVKFERRFYVHLALLHASLIGRLAGDLLDAPGLRRGGAWLSVAAIGLFLVSTIVAARSPAARRALTAEARTL